jgi:RNA polymerase sigma factor (sigma-70 family)
MSAAPPSVVLVSKLRASGGEDAVVEVYRRYFLRMVALLRRRLPGPLRPRVDADDLAQSAWGSFLGGLQRGKLDLEGRDSLWPLLAVIAVRKLQDQMARATAQCRDVGRETALAPERAGPSAEPSPAEALAVEETVQMLQQRLGDETQQEILRLRLDGLSVEEIAERVQLSGRTVKRVLHKVRELWEGLCREAGEAPPC